MRFLIRKRRTAPAVIIVALIDVLIVLVIFLLVTTTFKQQPAMKLALPTSTTALKSGANENPPMIVSIGTDGVYRFGADNLPVTPDQLRERIVVQSEKARSGGQEPKLAVNADKAAPWGKIVQVMDIANEAHVKILSAYMKESGKP
jgi:biopolymer transport protein ExbD